MMQQAKATRTIYRRQLGHTGVSNQGRTEAQVKLIRQQNGGKTARGSKKKENRRGDETIKIKQETKIHTFSTKWVIFLICCQRSVLFLKRRLKCFTLVERTSACYQNDLQMFVLQVTSSCYKVLLYPTQGSSC